jgi:DNA-binding CsgD family transcriptional regulator
MEPPGGLSSAQAAAAAGDWEQVGALLADLTPADRDESVAAAFLGVRAALHADAPARALATLDGLADVLARPDELVTATMLRGTALVALGRHDEGLALLEQAAAGAVGDRRHEALLALARGLWRAERLGAVEPALDAILSAHAVTAAPAHVLARTYQLYGWFELRRRRRPIAARHFQDALDALACSARPDRTLQAALLHAVLAIAIDTLDLRLLERVRTTLPQIDWAPVALNARKHAVLSLLALGELLLGDLRAAWEIGSLLRAAAAPGLQQLQGDLVAAQVARAGGDAWTPARLAEHAIALAGQISWADTGADGVRALLTLVADAAATDAPSARALLAVYDSLPPPMPAAPFEDDSDLLALAHLARAAVEDAAGNVKAQIAPLRAAIALAREAGNDYREMLAALAFAPLDRRADALQRADELTRLVPRSWLRRQYDALAAQAASVQALTRGERRVMLALIEGLTTQQIAARFGRSTNTIRNHTRRVFTVMGVRSRSELTAQCAALGLIATRTPAPGDPTAERCVS